MTRKLSDKDDSRMVLPQLPRLAELKTVVDDDMARDTASRTDEKWDALEIDRRSGVDLAQDVSEARAARAQWESDQRGALREVFKRYGITDGSPSAEHWRQLSVALLMKHEDGFRPNISSAPKTERTLDLYELDALMVERARTILARDNPNVSNIEAASLALAFDEGKPEYRKQGDKGERIKISDDLHAELEAYERAIGRVARKAKASFSAEGPPENPAETRRVRFAEAARRARFEKRDLGDRLKSYVPPVIEMINIVDALNEVALSITCTDAQASLSAAAQGLWQFDPDGAAGCSAPAIIRLNRGLAIDPVSNDKIGTYAVHDDYVEVALHEVEGANGQPQRIRCAIRRPFDASAWEIATRGRRSHQLRMSFTTVSCDPAAVAAGEYESVSSSAVNGWLQPYPEFENAIFAIFLNLLIFRDRYPESVGHIVQCVSSQISQPVQKRR